MQKKLIALAIAGMASGAAFAQSAVTIYGRLDYGFMSRSGDSGGVPERNGKSEFASGMEAGSRLGFKGTEDLGNGLKGIFEVEFGIKTDEGTNTSAAWGNRHSYVGLTGNFGTVVGGRLDGVRYGIFNKYDPFAGGGMGNFTQMTNQVDRADNAVAYISPTFAGFTGVLAYSSNIGQSTGLGSFLNSTEASGNRGDAKLNTAMLSYDNGPISVNLDAERVYFTSAGTFGVTPILGAAEVRVYTVGASYDFGVVKLSALYDKLTFDLSGAPDLNKVRSWFVGAKAPIGSSIVLKAQYGETKDTAPAGEDAKARKWGLGADYKLSKRTNFYADYGQIHNNSASAIEISPFPNTYGPLNASGVSGGYGTRGFDLGIAHTF